MDGTLAMQTRNLDFHYGDFQALFEVNLDFRRHDVTALIGPSSCGKSTLLLCLNRMNDLIPRTRALDPISTAKIEELIGELKQRRTIIIVTHNMQQAARVSSRTAFFLNGRVIEEAESDNVPGRDAVGYRLPADCCRRRWKRLTILNIPTALISLIEGFSSR